MNMNVNVIHIYEFQVIIYNTHFMHYTSISSVGNYTLYTLCLHYTSISSVGNYTDYTLYTLCLHYTSISSAGKYTNYTLYTLAYTTHNFKCR